MTKTPDRVPLGLRAIEKEVSIISNEMKRLTSILRSYGKNLDSKLSNDESGCLKLLIHVPISIDESIEDGLVCDIVSMMEKEDEYKYFVSGLRKYTYMGIINAYSCKIIKLNSGEIGILFEIWHKDSWPLGRVN